MLRGACSRRAGVPAKFACELGAIKLAATRRRREEDHPLRVAGHLREVANHRRLAPAARLGARYGCPHPLVELTPELLDQPLLVLGHIGIALREQHIAMTGFQPEQLHRSELCPNTSTGPAPAPIPPSPAATASPVISLARRAAASSVSPRASRAAIEDEWVHPEPCVAPPGWRGPSIRTASPPGWIRTSAPSSVWPPVTIAACGPSAWTARASSSCVALSPRPVSSRASSTLGVATVARGSRRSISAERASGSSRTAPLSATSTGSTTTGASPARSRASTTTAIVTASPSIPVLTASIPMSSATARICAMTMSGGTGWIESTPTVLWAVSAVIAVIPWTPQRANAFRSAWIPAPPPESEPAIEITAGMRRSAVIHLEHLDLRSRLGEQVRLLRASRVLAVGLESIPRWERDDVDLGQPVVAAQPPLQPAVVLLEQREHRALVLGERAQPRHRQPDEQGICDPGLHDPETSSGALRVVREKRPTWSLVT